MRTRKYLLYLTMGMFLFISLNGCEDNWDKHYSSQVGDETLYENIFEYINSNSELSVFAQMLKTTGYDEILSASQTYTVWAPLNSFLEGYDADNKKEALEIVENHISRGSINNPAKGEKYVKVVNGKRNAITALGLDIMYVNVPVKQKDVRTKNGLVHTLNGAVPYISNVWENILRGQDYDSLRNYMNSLILNVFDAEASTEIGINEDGNPVYDSIFVSLNTYFLNYGDLSSENDRYSFLYLKNSAWNQAYDQIAPTLNIPKVYGGAERSEELIRTEITRNLVYKEIEDLSSLDSIISASGRVFYRPQYIFGGAKELFLSNGTGYEVDDFPFIDVLTWNTPLIVQAESPTGRSSLNNEQFVESGRGGKFDIYNSYVLFKPIGTSDFTKSTVTFSIPNVRSTKYKIYVVFVPPVVEREDNTLESKVSFTLNYMNEREGNKRERITPANNIISGTEITKMFVHEIEFPFANIISTDYEKVDFTIQITNDVSNREESDGLFTRDMRIDYIILEPVVE